MNIVEIGKMNEDQARDYLETIRWPNGPVCPHCQCQNVTRLQGEAHRTGAIQCNNAECRQQFTVTVGSVMESSHIPLVKWAMAWHLLCSSKRGMSATQLQRNLRLGSYRTAWLMAHRIRIAMEGKPLQESMSGVVEGDNNSK
ncbi:MAG: transposase [Planctomycetia bacterium]|nr:transposase [Planctomycetia bacterium]